MGELANPISPEKAIKQKYSSHGHHGRCRPRRHPRLVIVAAIVVIFVVDAVDWFCCRYVGTCQLLSCITSFVAMTKFPVPGPSLMIR